MYQATMIWVLLVVLTVTCGSNGAIHKSDINDNKVSENEIVSQTKPPPVPCTCGVFLSGQFVKGSQDQPKGYPALLQEQEQTFPCTNLGNKQCTNKCLDIVSILFLIHAGLILEISLNLPSQRSWGFI